MSMSKVVAVFDSGVGGISVLREIAHLMPHLQLLYIADSRYMPYGDKSAAFIQERCAKLATFAIENKASAIVIACNTATACAASYLRQIYPQLPILGVEPALKPAAFATKSGVIGVLATLRTLQSARFKELTKLYAQNVKVITCACYGLAEQIEKGELKSTKTYAMLKQYVEPLLAQNADVLVLGCTHYPFLKPILAQLVPANVQIIDTGAACAKYLQQVLSDVNSMQKHPNNLEFTQFFSSLDASKLAQTLRHLWRFSVKNCTNLPVRLC